MNKEQEVISRKNRLKAIEYFESNGELPKDRGPYDYVLHHIDESWKHDDIERYISWNIEDLVVMDYAEHTRLHQKGKDKKCGEEASAYGHTLSNEAKQRISDANKGKRTLEQRKHISDALKGRHLSEEHKKKLSEKAKLQWQKINNNN